MTCWKNIFKFVHKNETNQQTNKKKTAEKNKTNKGYELFLRNYLLFQSFPSNVFFPDIIKTKCGNRQ